MSDRYHRAYMKVLTDSIKNDAQKIPYVFFLDKAVGLATKHMIQAIEETNQKAESQAWHDLNNRFIFLLSKQEGADAVNDAKFYTRQIEKYIKENIAELTPLVAEKDRTKKMHARIDENADRLFEKLGITRGQNGELGVGR